MTEFIYCREYGLEPAVYGFNYGKSEANGNPLVIINRNVKTTDWIVDTKTNQELVSTKRTLYYKVITLENFLTYDRVYVGKRTNMYFQRVMLGFGDKWKIRDLAGNLNNLKFNVWDRAEVKGILNALLTEKQEEVFNLLYTQIHKTDGVTKFLAVLESILEYKEDFLELLKPYEEKYLDVPDDLLTDGNGLNGSNKAPTNSKQTTNSNSLWLGVGAVGLGLYALKKKKVI